MRYNFFMNNRFISLDRSTDFQSVSLSSCGKVVASKVFEGGDSRSADYPVKLREFLADNSLSFDDIDAFVVGQGPGSFVGIRAALAFVQGLALVKGKKVYGMASTAAMTKDGVKRAIIGDARRSRFWVALYDGSKMVKDLALYSKEELTDIVDSSYEIVTPDASRIKALLEEIFTGREVISEKPNAARLAEVAIERPQDLKEEPLPIYLSPAVRPPE